MKYYPDSYYMTVYEKFTAINGEPSDYTRMMGDGYFTRRLYTSYFTATKESIKREVESILSRHTTLNDFTCTETDNGWKYERYVKWMDEMGFEYEIVPEGQHTDHEEYTVEISLFKEVHDAFQRLS